MTNTTSVTLFAFQENLVRVLGTAEAPLFVASDVCRILGIANHRDALADFTEKEKGVEQIDTLGGRQEVLVVTESGLYRLIFRSDKPNARIFQDWVLQEVLPSIHKTGQYSRVKTKELTKDELLQMFIRAKTGRVQMALLPALGLAANRGISEPPMNPGRNTVNLDKFWETVSELLKDESVKQWFHVKRLLEGSPEKEVLLLTMAVEGFDHFEKRLEHLGDRADVRVALKSSMEWVGGSITKRIGKQRNACKCWAFKAESNGRAALYEVAKLIYKTTTELQPQPD